VPFIPLIAAGIGAAAAGVEIAEQPSTPAAPSATTTAQQQADAANAAAQAQAEALQKRRGLAATTLTSPLGASSPASIAKSTLG
jgi:hypothetical protein